MSDIKTTLFCVIKLNVYIVTLLLIHAGFTLVCLTFAQDPLPGKWHSILHLCTCIVALIHM